GRPAAHAREALQDEAGVHLEHGRAVRVAARRQRVDEGDVIDAAREVRQQIADPLAVAAVPRPAPRTAEEVAVTALEGDDTAGARQRLAVTADQLRLVLEGVEVADGAGAEDLEDAPGLRGEVRPPPLIGGAGLVGEERGERDAPQTGAHLAEEL